MTSVLDFPVAEQYPSRTETSSTATSKRSSVISVTTTGKKKPTPKGRQSRCGRTTMQRHRRCSCDWLCRDGAAQNGPIDIRPEVFAAHGAAGSALDGRASFGRNGTDTVTPLADEYRRNGEVSGKTRSAPWCR